MDDATKKMMLTIVTGLAKKAAIVISTTLTAHGIAVTGNSTEYIASGIVLAVTLGYGVWTDYLKAIVLSQLEVLKAKSLAQAAKLHANNIAPPDAAAIAAASVKSPDMATLSVEEVKKAAASLPAAVAGAATLVALIFAAQVIATPAFAQKRFVPTGNLPADIKNAVTPAASTSEGSKSLRQKLLQDLAKPFLDLANFIGDDAENAIALSTSIPGIQDGHGQQCWIKARNFTAVIKAHPVPLTLGGMTDLEALRLLAISSKQLCEDTHCTQVFTDLKNAAITLAQTGFGAIGATAVRAAPSLQDVCTQIPNVPLAEPLASVPAAPIISPIGVGKAAPTSSAPVTPQ